MKLRYLVFLFCLASFAGYAQDFTAKHEQIHQQILSLQFQSAKQGLATLEADDPAGLWLKSYQLFLAYLTKHPLLETGQYITQLDELLEKAGSLPEGNPFQLLALADGNLFKAYIHLTLGEYLWAGSAYLRAQRYSSRLLDKYPQFVAKDRLQLIDILANKWIYEHFPRWADKDTDELLHQAYLQHLNHSEQANIPVSFKREIRLVGILLYPYIEDNPEAVFRAVQDFPTTWSTLGPVESYTYAKSAQKASEHKLAFQVLKKADSLAYNKRFNELNMALGISYLNQLNPSCLRYLKTYIAQQKEGKNVSYAQLKLSWYYASQAQSDSVQYYLQQIRKSNARTSEEKQAAYEAGLASHWTPELIAARLLFDGGNYLKATQVLLKLNPDKLDPVQTCTYYYHLARSYEQLNQYSRACVAYEQVIRSGLDQELYYPAYAAYYLARLHANHGAYALAKMNIKTCLSIDCPIYQNSIQRRARHLLSDIPQGE